MAAVAHDMLKMVWRLGRSGDSRPIQWRPPTPLPPAQGTPWTMPWSSSPRRCGALLGSHEATFRQPVFQFLQRLCAKLRIFLIECIARQDLPKAPGSEPTEYHQSLHLSVHDGNGLYRLELAVQADTTLRQLDEFLRGMWLECCGHLREFTILGTRYSNLAPHRDDPNWLSGIRNRMRRELRDLGADVIVTTSYIDRSELPSLLDLVASPEAADESRELLTLPMDGPLSQGTCSLCEDMVNDLTASGHLIECIARQNLPNGSGTDPTGHDQSLHLWVHDGSGLYWMELAVRADTTLRQLDEFLRGMWLECCSHLSEFTIQGTRYSNLAPHPDDPNAAAIRADYWMEDDEEHTDIAVADVMPMGALVSYEYDYGSTTELFLENLGRHGDLVGLLRPRQPWHGDRIAVLARNEPDEECVACEEPARWRLLASEYEAREPIPFCDECRPEAGHYQLVLNSPREGTDCYDNVMSWDGMPIGEPDF